MMNPIIVIPSRMGSTRLAKKPLAVIHGEPMILKVWRLAVEADIAPVVVSCDDVEIARTIQDAGGQAFLTQGAHATGSDRIYEAVQKLDPEEKYTEIINVQGDLPIFPPETLQALLAPFHLAGTHMATFVQPIQYGPPEAVRVWTEAIKGSPWLNCLNFSRTGEAHYAHIGVYAFRRQTLATFASLPQSSNELRESLEQLRILDNRMSIVGVVLEKEQFVSIDTPKDLEHVRRLFSENRAAL